MPVFSALSRLWEGLTLLPASEHAEIPSDSAPTSTTGTQLCLDPEETTPNPSHFDVLDSWDSESPSKRPFRPDHWNLSRQHPREIRIRGGNCSAESLRNQRPAIDGRRQLSYGTVALVTPRFREHRGRLLLQDLMENRGSTGSSTSRRW